MKKRDYESTAVAQEVERSSTNQKGGGLIPGPCNLHAKVFLGKM